MNDYDLMEKYGKEMKERERKEKGKKPFKIKFNRSVVGLLMIGVFFGFILGVNVENASEKAVTTPPVITTPTPSDPHVLFTYDNLLIRLNEARLAHGLPQLATDNYLSSEAQKDMINNCPNISHDNFRNAVGKGDFKSYTQVAEDLASGDATPLAAVTGLLNSPTHADIMVGSTYNWTVVGIGVSTTPTNCVSFIFGK